MPRVAVNVVTWNGCLYIERCLSALFHQSRSDFGVTIVDNGSSDDTVALVGRWLDRGVRLIESPVNVGYAKAHNQAIAATESEFVLTLNQDAFLDPHFIELMLGAMESRPTAGSASGRLLRISAKQLSGASFDRLEEEALAIDSAGLMMRRSRRQALRCDGQPAAKGCSRPAWIFGPDGSAAFYRRKMLEDAAYRGEYFDELFVTHKEDVDLAWRAQLLGWDSVYVPGAVAYHVRGFRPGERADVDAGIRRDAVKNRWLMLVKNERPELALRDVPFISMYEVGIVGYLILRERSSLPAIPAFLRLLPEALRRRKDLQQRRKRGFRQMSRWFANKSDVAFPCQDDVPT
jgi:GT2 family glycosyltransferase